MLVMGMHASILFTNYFLALCHDTVLIPENIDDNECRIVL